MGENGAVQSFGHTEIDLQKCMHHVHILVPKVIFFVMQDFLAQSSEEEDDRLTASRAGSRFETKLLNASWLITDRGRSAGKSRY